MNTELGAEKPIIVRADGHVWMAVRDGFTNLQECPAGFSNTVAGAIESLKVDECEHLVNHVYRRNRW
ncbi:hypothetical protein UFOVP435_75 [uncultured Caudovirales phage]|uniref:Uncharacterized protein n=1 Tax=uncultured Caudovirales phage TaxID=2100421 RepID=A0A6J5MDQ6_9CAUD|nr:hypothetical protein UFOVP435_75 [uncultured Caudovirales phage]